MRTLTPLFAPTGLSIIGILMQDGSVTEFEFHFDKESQTRAYQVPSGAAGVTEKMTLVDSSGAHWKTEDVEWYTLFEHKSK